MEGFLGKNEEFPDRFFEHFSGYLYVDLPPIMLVFQVFNFLSS